MSTIDLLSQPQISSLLGFVKTIQKQAKAFQDELFKGHIKNMDMAEQNIKQWSQDWSEEVRQWITIPQQSQAQELSAPVVQVIERDQMFQNFEIVGGFNDSIRPENPITLEQSDLYETFDQKFKSLVPKKHPQLQEMMDIYTQKTETSYLGLILGVRKVFQCWICFYPFYEKISAEKHIIQFHKQGQKNLPYTFCSEPCILGCQEIGDAQHLILYHTFEQLRNFGINRNYLKFSEGYIEWQEFQMINNQPQKINLGQKRTYGGM